MRFITLLLTAFISLQSFSEEKFPDGTPIPDWFRQNEVVNIQTLGKKYNILMVPGSSFACPGYVRLAYCVSYETIVNSLPKFAELAKEYF